MRVVFELQSAEPGRAFVVDVTKVDEKDLVGVHKGNERKFPVNDIRNATTVSGRPFSLRPFDAKALASLGKLPEN
jgi:hypothetical protein